MQPIGVFDGRNNGSSSRDDAENIVGIGVGDMEGSLVGLGANSACKLRTPSLTLNTRNKLHLLQ